MQYAITTKYLQTFRKQRNLFIGLLSLSLSINILQGLERLLSQEKTILLPPSLQREVWVRGMEVSDSYLEEWAYYLSALLLNVSPQTIGYQTDLVLRHVSPEFYPQLKQQLRQEAEHLQKNNVATIFQAKEVMIDRASLKATIKGTLISWVGKERVSESQQVYEMAFTITAGKFLQVVRFAPISSSTEGENHE